MVKIYCENRNYGYCHKLFRQLFIKLIFKIIWQIKNFIVSLYYTQRVRNYSKWKKQTFLVKYIKGENKNEKHDQHI